MKNDKRLHLRLFKTPALALASSLSVFTLSGCGGSSTTDEPNPGTTTQAYLQAAGSEADFESAFKASYNQTATNISDDRASDGSVAESDAAATPSASFSTSGNTTYSQTYTLESGVDEADIVKYDGEHLYIAKTRFHNHCCFLESTAVDAATDAIPEGLTVAEEAPLERGAIRVLATNPNTASAETVTEIQLSTDDWVQGLYRYEENLVAISSQYTYAYYGNIWLDIAYWGGNAEESFKASNFSVSSPAAPMLDWDVEIEGHLVQSRRIGDTLYTISRFSPRIPEINHYPRTQTQIDENSAVLANYSAEDFIPTLTVNGASSPLHNAANCLMEAPAESSSQSSSADSTSSSHRAFPVITSITAIPLNNPDAIESVCYSAETAGVYLSTEALYVTHVDWAESSSKTRIHKFALNGTDIDYRGSGEVNGALWLGGQQDFRINEHEGHLRLVTGEWTGDENDRNDYYVHVLKEAESETPSLELVASLPNEAHPEEIGKANERLFGVRFYGDLAYLVTFEQIDPLYVLDLSDPEAPFIAGELEIPGVNDFLHPVNDALLLGLGRDLGQVKLELFDVSDISAPSSIAVLPLSVDDANWSWSEALHNRHAFTYLTGEFVDHIAVPTTSHGRNNEGWFTQTNLHMVELRNKDQGPDSALLVPVGALEINDSNTWWYGNNQRSVLHDDAVYFIFNDEVWSGFWGGTETTGPQ